jgi:AcrR family transcriptional regulator
MVAYPADDPAFEDLTARARIRDAALRMFAERGTDGATIRDIAKAAGASAGLVRHHFGSKEALRDVCDAYALDRLMRIKEQAILDGQIANPGFMLSVHPTMLLFMQYLARSMVDGSASAAAMFDGMVDLAEKWLAEHSSIRPVDPRAYAAVLVATSMGPLVMRDQLSRALGADILSPAGHLRMTRGSVDLHAHSLLDPEVAAQAHATLDRLQENPPNGAAERAARLKEHDNDRGDPN